MRAGEALAGRSILDNLPAKACSRKADPELAKPAVVTRHVKYRNRQSAARRRLLSLDG